jgi:hypothetical protein
MAGVLLLKDAYFCAGTVIALMVCTWLFKKQQRSHFEPSSASLPLEMATALDMGCDPLGQGPSIEQVGTNPYVQPELTAPRAVQPEPQ